MNILLLAIGAALVNNVILSQFLGLCPFLGVSKSVNTATGMGAAVVFVMTIASFVTSVVYYGILRRFGLEYLNTIVFILVIAALVQFVEMFLKKKVKSSNHDHLGKIITYASGLDANVIVWIVKEAREEHRSELCVSAPLDI